MAITIHCPNCRATVRSPQELIGKKVQCPKCSTIFRVEDPNPGIEVVEDVEVVDDEPAPRPKRRPISVEVDDDRPRRRPRADDDDDDDYDRQPRRTGRRARAESLVKGPALGMAVIGVIGLLFAIVNLVVYLASPNELPPGIQADKRSTYRAVLLGTSVITIVVQFIWGTVVTLGGYKLLRLEGYGSAMTASIFALLPCNLACLIGMPFGIWALIVLNNPDVKRSFSA